LESLLQKHFGVHMVVRYVLYDKPASGETRQSATVGGARSRKDIVSKALEIFGGELISIEDTVTGHGSQDEEGF